MQQPRPSLALRLNLLVLRLTRNWLRIVLTIIGIFVTLPFAAPTLMYIGAEAPARAIYTLYRPFCHQFPFRTFFLYGEQSVYPLASTGVAVRPFEYYAQQSHIVTAFQENRLPSPPFNVLGFQEFTNIQIGDDISAEAAQNPGNFALLQLRASEFIGNPEMGYKMTLCERDISIYLALFTTGLIYSIPAVRRRVRPAPLWLYVFLGLGPIGVDGVSQLLGYPPFEWWEPRETLPAFRVLTGALFGFMTAWLAFPYFEYSAQDTRYEVQAKLAEKGIQVEA